MDVIEDPLKTNSVGNEKTLKQKRVVGALILLFLLIGLIAAVLWWLFYRNFETTEDAYVGGNMVVLASRQDGTVIAYHVDDTNYVKVGQVLVQLDPIDYSANFEQQKAKLALAVQHVLGLYEDVQQKKANVALEEAKYSRSALDVSNREGLAEAEAITKEDFEHFSTELKVTSASLDLARHQLEAAEAALGITELHEHPAIVNAKMDLEVAYIALQRCSILAPVSGYVAKRNVQVGQPIKAGTALMSIIPLDNVWVEANFKETQLEFMRIGQKVELNPDFYDDVVFHGRVQGLLPGTGSVFALLPAQNATGNWIKIVQRVPVRISLDPEEVKKHPLVLGLSIDVSVDISNSDGLLLAEKPIEKTVSTPIFEIDLTPINEISDRIIEENLKIKPPSEMKNLVE